MYWLNENQSGFLSHSDPYGFDEFDELFDYIEQTYGIKPELSMCDMTKGHVVDLGYIADEDYNVFVWHSQDDID